MKQVRAIVQAITVVSLAFVASASAGESETTKTESVEKKVSVQKRTVSTQKVNVSTQKKTVSTQKKTVSTQKNNVSTQKKTVSTQKNNVSTQNKVVSTQSKKVSTQSKSQSVSERSKSTAGYKFLTTHAHGRWNAKGWLLRPTSDTATDQESPVVLERGGVAASYTMKSKLGSGGQGAVFAYDGGQNAKPARIAVKKLRVDGFDSSCFEEATNLTKLPVGIHPNIVGAYGTFIPNWNAAQDDGNPEKLLVAMELVNGSPIAKDNRIDDALRDATLPELKAIVSDVLRGLVFAFKQTGLMHRDIKGDNLMIERGSGLTRIIDWGLAVELRSGAGRKVGKGYGGTEGFIAPEMRATYLEDNRKGGYDERADTYSVGKVLEVLVKSAKLTDKTTLDFIALLTNTDPRKRPTPAAALQNGWFDGFRLGSEPALRKARTALANRIK